MNKRISTMFASFLLMAGVAFAADGTTYSQKEAKPTEGLKVYLGNEEGTSFLKSAKVTDAAYKFANTVTESEAGVFTVTGVKTENGKLMFKLVDAAGKVVYGKEGTTFVEAASEDDVKKGYCWFTYDDNNTDDNYNDDKITLGGKPLAYDMATAANVAKMLIAKKGTTSSDLNSNLSGKGFSFKFPNAASDASTVNSTLELGETEVSGECFVVANAAGLKLAKEGGVTADNLKAATFIVLNPNATFGITSLDAAKGEGFGFTTVKGEKLNATNVKKDGKIAFMNAIYGVSEDDLANKAGQYTIKMTGVKVTKGTDENFGSELTVYVGAYSLTTGGLKTYITTKGSTDKLSLAQTTGNTWAKASDLLKTDGAAIYNIYFTGTKPADGEEGESLYGKYLVSTYAKTEEARAIASFSNEALAPAKVDLKAPVAQWVIVSMQGSGAVTFKNLETNETFNANLYKTDKAGIYQAVKTSVGDIPAENIKLVAVSANEGFLTLSDAQLKQKAQLVFNGESSVAVEKVYMSCNADDSKFEPVSDAAKSYAWSLEKAEAVKNNVEYIYLKDDEVAKKKADMLTIQAYYLVDDKKGLNHEGSDYKLVDHNDKKADNLSRLVFKKNVDGTYSVICLDEALDADEAADNYIEVVKADAKMLKVDVNTPSFAEVPVGSEKADYAKVVVDFFQMGASLDAVPRHATLDSEEGSISLKENKNGILEGIIGAEGLTFWLDTADSKAELPSFYISKGIAEGDSVAPVRNFLYFAQDSLRYWNEAQAKFTYDENYGLEGTYGAEANQNTDVKAIFRPATLAGVDTINTTVNGKNVVVAAEAKEDVCLGGINNFKFYITKLDAGYSVRPVDQPTKYLYALNGKLGFTSDTSKALPVTVGEGNPTSNESIDNSASSSVVVIGNAGSVTIQGAQGETAYVRNLLGMPLAETVVTSDNATIAVPAGIVLVTVGDETVKVVVK